MAKKKFKAKPFKDWLDFLCRLAVKTRDEYTCQKCDMSVQGYHCHWHHIIMRKLNHTRWDLLNGITFCDKCHRKWEEGPELQVWFSKTFPVRYAYITTKPRHIGTWKEWDFVEVEEMLLRKLADLEFDWDNVPEAKRSRLTRRLKEMGE